MKSMTKKERIDAALRGEAVDRIPVSLWRHFYQNEDTARGLADAMLLFQQDYDWDFMKINPRASYHIEDWGAEFRFYKDGITKPQRVNYPVKKISDLEKIRPLDPLKSKVLRDHLDAVHYIKKELPKNMYLEMTVFTPLSIVGDMTETRDTLLDYILEDPKAVKQAIEAVTQTFENFVTELLNIGISGIFYATTYWGTYERITNEQFDEFSRPYDMRILEIVKDCPFNVMHVCKSRNMLEKLADYPVNAFNWDTQDPTNPGLGEGKEFTGKTVIGGIDQKTSMMASSSDMVVKDADEALRQTGGRNWILGAGCTYEPPVPTRNLKAIREWVEQVPVKF
jgi:uroporphyrinogen decarboxylase